MPDARLDVRLGERPASALALLVPLLGCGEEAAALAFDGLASTDGDPASAAALPAIAEEERVHDDLLQCLAVSLPVADTAAVRRAARRFHVDLGRGSALAHLVMGYAIAARAQTQLAALQGAVAFYLPAMLLSGFLYPFATLPLWAQAIGNVFPLTHFIRAATGLMLRGDGLAQVAGHALPMAAFTATGAVIAVCFQARAIN